MRSGDLYAGHRGASWRGLRIKLAMSSPAMNWRSRARPVSGPDANGAYGGSAARSCLPSTHAGEAATSNTLNPVAGTAGSSRGGERAAAFYSLIGTAKLNGLNPERYLRHVLPHIAEHPINRIAELPPWNIPSTHTTTITTNA
jgi:hypothetical protein